MIVSYLAPMRTPVLVVSLAVGLVTYAAWGTYNAFAQEGGVDLPTIDGTTGEVVAPAPKPKPKAQNKPQVAASPKAQGSENAQRLDEIEGQLADLQVVVGTFESLARNRPAGGGAVGDANLEGRVRDLEIQMQQLSAQLAQLSQQLGSGAAALRAQTTEPSPAPLASAGAAEGESGFGTTVSPAPEAGSGDPIGQILQNDGAGGLLAGTSATPGVETQLASAGPAGGSPQQAFESARGQLLQQNFEAAEQSFRKFLAQNPGDPLASEAQYYIGESLYVRGQYKPAAEAYLQGYNSFRQSRRAPDSLLKLAMSLSRLNQRDSACNAFNQLESEYPNAPAQVKRRATTERERIGC